MNRRGNRQVQLDFDSVFGNFLMGNSISASDIEIERERFSDGAKATMVLQLNNNNNNNSLSRAASPTTPASRITLGSSTEAGQMIETTPKSNFDGTDSFAKRENATPDNNNNNKSSKEEKTNNTNGDGQQQEQEPNSPNTVHPTSFGANPISDQIAAANSMGLQDRSSSLGGGGGGDGDPQQQQQLKKKVINLDDDDELGVGVNNNNNNLTTSNSNNMVAASISQPSNNNNNNNGGLPKNIFLSDATEIPLSSFSAVRTFKGGDLSEFISHTVDFSNNMSLGSGGMLLDGTSGFSPFGGSSASSRRGRGQKVVVHCRRDVGGMLMKAIFEVLNDVEREVREEKEYNNNSRNDDSSSNKGGVKKDDSDLSIITKKEGGGLVLDDSIKLQNSDMSLITHSNSDKFDFSAPLMTSNNNNLSLGSGAGGQQTELTKIETLSVDMGATADNVIKQMLAKMRKGREVGLTKRNVALFDSDLFELIIAEPDGRPDDEFGFQKFRGQDVLNERWLTNVALVPCSALAAGVPRKHSFEFEAAGTLSHLPFSIQMPQIGAIVLSQGQDSSSLPPLIRSVHLPADLPMRDVPAFLCNRVFYHQTKSLKELLEATLTFDFGGCHVPVFIRQQQNQFDVSGSSSNNASRNSNLLLSKFRLDAGAVTGFELVSNMTLLLLWLYGVRKLVITATQEELSKDLASSSTALVSNSATSGTFNPDSEGSGMFGGMDAMTNSVSSSQYHQSPQQSQNVVEMDDAQASTFRTYLVRKINHLGNKQERQFDVHGAYIYNHLPGTEFGTKNPRRAIADISSLKVCSDSPIRCIIEYGGVHNDPGVSMTFASATNAVGSDKNTSSGSVSRDVLEFLSPDECKAFVSQVNVLRNIQRLHRIRSMSFISSSSGGGAGGGGAGGAASGGGGLVARKSFMIRSPAAGGAVTDGRANVNPTFVTPTVHAPGNSSAGNSGKGGFFTKLFS